MGKGTDKLYITHSEWASEDAYSANVGAGAGAGASASKAKSSGVSFKRLPFNFCALSLQPFAHAVCTAQGTIFELTNILPWIKKHGTNPVDGTPLRGSELIKLHLAKNEDGEYIDPVTFKVFTDNTHIVALGTTGNVFAYDTVDRLNIKAKMWRDLVTDTEFSRADLIILQDPQNVAARDLSRFQYLRDGEGAVLTTEQEMGRREGVNSKALGSSAKILRATAAVARARQERTDPNRNPALTTSRTTGGSLTTGGKAMMGTTSGGGTGKPTTLASTIPYNAAQHTTGKAAASFTSTGLTPHTAGERALLTDEEYMLKARRVKNKGYARVQTNVGDLKMELQTEYAPKAVWNFVQLAKRGYYRDIRFHRNIRNFMIQGGDPTGTGKGGRSVWGKNFNDEFDGPLTHDARGVVSMANKGKNTNSSQFFITYRPTKHLDRKHTIFGRVVDGLETLSRLEDTRTDSSDRPIEDLTILDIVIFVDPFEEYQKDRRATDEAEREKEEVRRRGGTEDEKTTWTGKRVVVPRVGDDGRSPSVDSAPAGEGSGTGSRIGVRVGVGRYLKDGQQHPSRPRDDPDDEESSFGPVVKKVKNRTTSEFGQFDNW